MKVLWLLLISFGSRQAFADAPELIKRAAVRADWTSSCAKHDPGSVGTLFSLNVGGFGYVVTYQFDTTDCTGTPKYTTRTGVRFITATSEETKGAADFAIQPVVVRAGEPLAFDYTVINNGNGTLTFKLVKYVVLENGKQVVKKVDPSLDGSSSVYYAVNRGPTLRSYLHDRIMQIDRFKMDLVVNAVRSHGGFAELKGPLPTAIALTSVPFTPNAAAFLSGMNKFVFGNEGFLTPVNGGNQGRVELNGQTKMVFIDGGYGSFYNLNVADAQLQTELGIAHAVASYVYEFYLEKISAEGKSIYGQPSLAESFPELSDTPTRDEIIDSALARAMQSAEIDGISISLFGQLGTDTSKLATAYRAQLFMGVQKFFSGTVDENLELGFIQDSELGALVELYAHELVLREELAKF